MLVQIPYGKKQLELDLPENNVMVCSATDVKAPCPGIEIIRKALAAPIKSRSLSELAEGKKRVCIVINDVTRPTPSKVILEGILEELEKAGIPNERIVILVANGNHRPTKKEELRRMLGDAIVNNIKIVNHVAADDEAMVSLGETSMGVPILVNRLLVESDLRILTGIIRPHQSAGFSGGRKSILPGCASVKSIRIHHSFPIFPISPQLGKYEGNPFHEQALEGAKLVGVDFIVNVIENAHGEIIDAVAGELDAAHREGVRKCASIWMYRMEKLADIVITSPGGYPKDINLHQSQKALAPCELCLKEGGVIILTAECSDGAGHIPDWFQDAASPEEVMERFRKTGWTPEANAKPFLMARPLSKYHVIIVCDNIPEKVIQDMFMIPAHTLEEAWEKARLLCNKEDPRVVVLPTAGDVIPFVADAGEQAALH